MRAPCSSTSRVVVTGYGIHAAVEQLDAAFAIHQRGEHLVAWHELTTAVDCIRCVGAACSTEPPLPYLTQRKWLKYMGLETQFSLWAAGKALQHAGLWAAGCDTDATRASMALLLATGPIAFELKDVLPGLLASRGPNAELDYAAMGTAGLRCSSPMMPFHTLRNMPIGLVSMVFGIKGHNAIYYPDAEQSLFAFSAAARAIEHGRVLSALVGGTAHLLSMMPMVSYQRRGYLAESPSTAIPFASGHRGWALGDAAAMVVLENEGHARARGARIYGILEVDPTSLSMDEQIGKKSQEDRQPDLTLVTGTQTEMQDANATGLAGDKPCLCLDSITGYTGAASVALSLAAACRLLECPTLFENARWWQGTGIDVLSACCAGQQCSWGRLRLEATP